MKETEMERIRFGGEWLVERKDSTPSVSKYKMF
jgi:hypothetical protein